MLISRADAGIADFLRFCLAHFSTLVDLHILLHKTHLIKLLKAYTKILMS
jgi:hypothetical protein